jgi:hypothetical protein
METSLAFIFIAVIAFMLVVYMALFLSESKKPKSLTILATFAFIFVLAGIIFSENRAVGFALISSGIILSIVDIIININSKKKVNQ